MSRKKLPLKLQELDRRYMAVEAVQFKDKLARLGLWKTMHKMDEVIKQIGWEIAELTEAAEKAYRVGQRK